jgi:hypothetical protein
MIKSLCTLRPDLAKSRTVIMDAGIASEDNIAYLKQPLFHYIGVNRSKADFTPIDTQQMAVIRQEDQYTLSLQKSEGFRAKATRAPP